MVEAIDIRGKGSCQNCNVVVAHKNGWGLYIDSYHSSKRCTTNFLGSTACSGRGEDNFGFYECVNKKHRCSSSEESTTQLWFGGQ